MATARYHFRIFLSSPGDVTDERRLANRVIDDDDLPYEAFLRDRVSLETMGWNREVTPQWKPDCRRIQLALFATRPRNKSGSSL